MLKLTTEEIVALRDKINAQYQEDERFAKMLADNKLDTNADKS